jgi:hypothetical protein
MGRNDPTFRMRREQLGELVNLTSMMPVPRRTTEMPAVELLDLLRKDRELDAVPAAVPESLSAIAGEVSERESEPEPEPGPERDDAPVRIQLAAGTVRIARPSSVGLALGCLAAFAGGFALTAPLWW